jgi:hypothetical protein
LPPLFSKLLATTAHAVDRRVGWHRLPRPLGILTLVGLRTRLRERNLHDTGHLFAGDAIATWPGVSAGWPAFNLNPKQHRDSLRRMADFDSEIVAVGHGEPIRSGGHRQVRDLVDGLERNS